MAWKGTLDLLSIRVAGLLLPRRFELQVVFQRCATMDNTNIYTQLTDTQDGPCKHARVAPKKHSGFSQGLCSWNID